MPVRACPLLWCAFLGAVLGRRAILTKRGVPVDAQLRSHMLFARSIEEYCELVDQATVYSTNSVGNPPQVKHPGTPCPQPGIVTHSTPSVQDLKQCHGLQQ